MAHVAEADVVRRIEPGLGAQVALRQAPEGAIDGVQPGDGFLARQRAGPYRRYRVDLGALVRVPVLVRSISLHDTRTGELRRLAPTVPERVGIYACGPTVYARIHVGNARPYVVFSLFKRFLEHEGYDAHSWQTSQT